MDNDRAAPPHAAVVEALMRREATEIENHVADAQLAEVVHEHQALLDHLREYRGLLSADFKFGRDEANAR